MRRNAWPAMATGAWLVVAAVVTGCRTAPPQVAKAPFALDESKLVDLTYAFDSTTVYWPTAQSFIRDVVAYGRTKAGYWYASNDFCASEHGGTHVDAPIHFGEGRMTVDAIPLQRLIGPAVVVDVSDACASDPDYRVRVDDLLAWEKRHGAIPAGAIVLARTGWGARWGEPERYFGSKTPDDVKTLHFPGYSEAAARFLIGDRRVDAVGLDTPSPDAGSAHDFPVQQALAAADMPWLVNVANLHLLPETGAFLIALPMKIGGGTGAPTRIVAVMP